MNRFFLFLLFCCIAPLYAQGQPLRFPVIYGDGMVLQRNQPLRLCGKSAPGQAVTAELNGRKIAAQTDAKGDFEVVFPAQQAGGPYRLGFKAGKTEKVFEQIYIGEVWLCSGQSNMEFALKDCATAHEDLQTAQRLPRIHLYNIRKTFIPLREIWTPARIRQVDANEYVRFGRWETCSATSAAAFSALGFHFARILSDSLDCHVGIISNAVDGSTTEGWIDRHSLEAETPEILQGKWIDNPHIMKWARNRAAYNLQRTDARRHRHPYEPTYLFEAAIRPLQAFPIRGVLWYQGESNAELIEMHERLFPLLEKSWRTFWNRPTLPFYFVQLSSLSIRPTWPAFRDSQRRLADRLPDTYMTVSSDKGDSLNIHPQRKRVIAERLAASALHHTYGFKGIVPCGPSPLALEREGSSALRVRFAWAEGLRSVGPLRPEWFEVAAADGVFRPATKVTIDGETLIVSSSEVARPQRVRYAYKPYTTADLVNGAGLPCSTFDLAL